MEVVVALAECDKCSDDVVTRRVAVIEWLVTEPVSQGIDAESGLLDEEDSENASVDETAPPVTPAETGDKRGEDQAHKEDNLEIVLVLPDDDWIFIEVGDVCSANSLRVLLHQHPAKVRVQQALANRVGILFCVGVAMVSSMVPSPPPD